MSERLAISMWDFSWLLRRDGAEAEYADWDRALDELAERGYNCVRIDAFPHLISQTAERFVIRPQRPRFMWGNHASVEVGPRRGLVEFVRKARERGVRVGLSSWFVDDDTHQRRSIRAPEDLSRSWRSVLDLLAGEGLLDAVAWVDLCNEFPLGIWVPAIYERLFGKAWPNVLPLFRRWSDVERKAVASYLAEAIDPLRSVYPQVRFTFSFQGFGASNVQALTPEALDCVEVHAWFVESPRLLLRSGQFLALLELPAGVAVHRTIGPWAFRSGRRRWLSELARRLDAWKAWAGGRPIFTSEGWASIYYEGAASDDAEWKWIKSASSEAIPLALDRGWAGLCTSNFSQPHFPGLWRDVGWHREMTRLIRHGS